MIDEKALEAALDVRVPGGVPVWDYFDVGGLIAQDAEEIGVKLTIPGRWHWHSEIRSDETRDMLKTIMRAAILAYESAKQKGEAEGWRDIESAPKDGTRVDLWHDEFGRYANCYWGAPEHCCGEAGQHCDSDWHRLEPGWVDGTLNVELSAPDFTHWRPLPEPPMLSAGGEG